MTIGRTDQTKGIDQLITAMAPLRERLHPVAIVVPFNAHHPLIEVYQREIKHRLLPCHRVSGSRYDGFLASPSNDSSGEHGFYVLQVGRIRSGP